ncbi:hypothetical protein D9758_012136 [Tetrapyrgos nigripes]|uniref:Uncharacterized protein n=1 Tax=Tetrapyrgos nigripes TaxID=182062 RepID=A0A8H5FPH2_9AGAR|nr:hypothetical protein D9758_012136 [Tetrapyrgos nigripes]
MAAEKDKKSRRKEEDAGYATGYETDSVASKPRTKLRKKKKQLASGDAGYETDDGYISSATSKSKSKSRFFRLGNRSKSTVDDDDRPPEDIPAVPVPPPVFRLPIAERFATTLGNLNANATVEPPLYGPPMTAAPSSPETPSIPTPKEPEQETLLLKRQSSLLTSINNSLSKRTSPAIRFRDSDSSGERSGAVSPTLSGTTTIFRRLSINSSSPTRPKPTISYPLERAPPSPPSSYTRDTTSSPVPPSASGMARSPSKRVPGPLFIHRIPSDQKIPTLLGANSKDDLIAPATPSPILSPFVVVTPNPATPSPDVNSNLLSATGLRPTSSGYNQKLSPSTGFTPLSRTPSNENVIVVPSADYIVPSPGLLPPNTSVFHHHGYEIPPPSPPPTSPLPRVPGHAHNGVNGEARPETSSEDSHDSSYGHGSGDGYFSSQQEQRYPNNHLSPSPIPGSAAASRSPTPRRGVESPFPTRPAAAKSGNGAGFGAGGFENRVKVPRYRDLYALQIPDSAYPSRATSPSPSLNGQRRGAGYGYADEDVTSPITASRREREPDGIRDMADELAYRQEQWQREELDQRLAQAQTHRQKPSHKRHSTQVGISVENPSDDEESEQFEPDQGLDEDMQSVLSRFRRDVSANGGAGRNVNHGNGSQYEDDESEDGYRYRYEDDDDDDDDAPYHQEAALDRRRSFEALQAQAQTQPYSLTPTQPLRMVTGSPSPSRPTSPPSRALSPYQLNSSSSMPIQKRVPLQPQRSIAGEALRERTRARMEAASPIPTSREEQEGWLSPGPSTVNEMRRRTDAGGDLKDLGGRGRANRGGFLGQAYKAYEVPGLPRSPSRSPYKEEFDDVGMGMGGDQDLSDDATDDRSHYPEDDRSAGMYRLDNSSRYTTYTTYSDGAYSRTSHGSFLDGEKSEEARERFLKRIGEMYDANGREKKDLVPPVPKLPEGLKMRAGPGTGSRVLDRVRNIEAASRPTTAQGSSTWI